MNIKEIYIKVIIKREIEREKAQKKWQRIRRNRLVTVQNNFLRSIASQIKL